MEGKSVIRERKREWKGRGHSKTNNATVIRERKREWKGRGQSKTNSASRGSLTNEANANKTCSGRMQRLGVSLVPTTYGIAFPVSFLNASNAYVSSSMLLSF